MEKEIIQLSSVDSYCKTCGFETLNPLVAVVDMAQAKNNYPDCRINYGLYALWLKNGNGCRIKYGRRDYDYQEGTVVSFAPGQIVEVETTSQNTINRSIGLLFHPDLIYGTALGRKISRYTFFSYEESEALHLSAREQEQYMSIIGNIRAELEHAIDKHSKELLCDHIGLLLDICLRFYDRQFITREKVNGDILAGFEKELDDYYRKGHPLEKGFPSVSYFADKLHLSTGYFGDLVKKETGVTAQSYIKNKIIDYSKHLLLESDDSVSGIAYQLGFEYPQHFTRLFKNSTGVSPAEYRKSN